MNKKILVLALAPTLIGGLAAVPAAQAKVVTGKYYCYLYSYQGVKQVTTYTGDFKIKAHGKYNSISPKKGKGKYVVNGKKFKFKSGPWKAFSGKVTKSTTGEPELMLHEKANGAKIEVNCFRR